MKYDRNIFHHDKVLIFDIESRTADWVFWCSPQIYYIARLDTVLSILNIWTLLISSSPRIEKELI